VIHKCPGVNDRKDPQQSGKNPLINRESAGNTMDHTNRVDRDTQEKIYNREEKIHSYSATV